MRQYVMVGGGTQADARAILLIRVQKMGSTACRLLDQPNGLHFWELVLTCLHEEDLQWIIALGWDVQSVSLLRVTCAACSPLFRLDL